MGKALTLSEVLKYLNVPEGSMAAKVHVTPEMAQHLLKRCNRANRKINQGYADSLRRDMESGHWYRDVDYISFNSKGVLVNGQHRLKALSDSSVEGLDLKFDFDTEQHISMDTGNNRTYGDQVRLSKKLGMDILPSRFKSIIMGGLKMIAMDEEAKVPMVTNTELNAIWEEYGDRLLHAEEIGLFDVGNRAGSFVKSALFWAMIDDNAPDEETLAHVAKVLRTGITEKPEDVPVIRLRDALVDLRGGGKKNDLLKAKYTQQTVVNVLAGWTTNRLPAKPQLHYRKEILHREAVEG